MPLTTGGPDDAWAKDAQAQATLAAVALAIRLPPLTLSNCQPTNEVAAANSESIKKTAFGGSLKITAEELRDQTKRFSASKHKNNFPPIMLLTEDRSLNYSSGIVYRGPISSSSCFSSVHLSISSHLILILSDSVAGLRAARETRTESVGSGIYQR